MTPYAKLNSQGNDFIFVEKHMLENELSIDSIKNYSSRNNIGCDQFFIIDTADKNVVRCDVYNQDGSVACQCGNGLRATMLYLNKKYNIESTDIVICNKAYRTEIRGDLISVDMGVPEYILCPDSKEFNLLNDGIITTVEIKDHNLRFSFISLSIGNEHSVVFSKNCIDNKDLISKSIENIFGHEMNIGFIENTDEYLSDNKALVNLMVNERGAGYTASCGSGATAAAICLFKLSELRKKNGSQEPNIKIKQQGGLLEVTKRHSNSFELTGPSSYDGDGYLD
tara:strand:+ start:63 stop:908 length:846 start_codon:yes stop_codon:yes gene_type:complete